MPPGAQSQRVRETAPCIPAPDPERTEAKAIHLKGQGSLPALGVAGSLHWTQLGSSPTQGDQPRGVPARSPRGPAGETRADFPHSQGREDNVLPASNVWPLSLRLLIAITITHVSLHLTEHKARTRLHPGSFLLVVLPAARSASLALQLCSVWHTVGALGNPAG